MKQTAEAEINEVADAFFEAFDNRAGRVPVGDDLYRLFGAGATVTKMEGSVADIMDVATFVEPRMKLLTATALTDFHEWEIEARTAVMGNIASRFSIYQKSGMLDGEPYEGRGRKVMTLYRTGGRWLISSVLWEDD